MVFDPDPEMFRRQYVIDDDEERPSLCRAMPLSLTPDSDGLVDTSDDDSSSKATRGNEGSYTFDNDEAALTTPDSDGLVDTSDDDSSSKATRGNKDSDTSDDDKAALTSGKF